MLFFERNLDLYVSSVDTGFTTDNTVKLAILAGSSIDYSTTVQNTYNYKIENTPNRLNKKVPTGFSAPKFKFKTYIKPLVDGANTIAAEHLLLYSLTGNAGTQDTTTYDTSFTAGHLLPELYFFIDIGDRIYKISNSVVKSADFKIDIKQILTASWETVGRTLEVVDALPGTYSDYSTSTDYLKCINANVELTVEQLLSGYTADVFLDGSDFLQKGTDSGVSITNNGATIVTADGIAGYEFATTQSQPDYLAANGAMPFTSNPQPSQGTDSWTFECLLRRNSTNTGWQNYLFSLIGDTNNRIYIQGASIFVDFFTNKQLYWYWDNYSIPVSKFPVDVWTHLAVTCNMQTRCMYLYIDGKMIGCNLVSNCGDTQSATTGAYIGGGGGNAFHQGLLAYPEIDYSSLTPKYSSDYSTFSFPVDANTVVRVAEDLTDDSGNAHSVTPTNVQDHGTYFQTGPTTGASVVNIGRSAAWTSPEWSIEVRFYFYASSTYGAGGDIYNDGVRRLYFVNNQIWCYVNGAAICRDNEEGYYANQIGFPKNTWHYVSFEYYDGNYYLFINGQLRACDTAKRVIPNAVSSTGTATLMDTNHSTSQSYYWQYFRLSDISRHGSGVDFTAPDYVTEVTGTLPIVSGNLKLKNDVQMVESNTLDNREIKQLGHYVRARDCQLNLSAYLRTGSNSTADIFDAINDNIDTYEDNAVGVTARLGASENGSVTVSMSKAFVALPTIKMQDVISSNIKLDSEQKDTLNDDIAIEYTTTAHDPDIYTPES